MIRHECACSLSWFYLEASHFKFVACHWKYFDFSKKNLNIFSAWCFRIQPNSDTRKKQLEGWCHVVLSYYRHHKLYSLDVVEAQSSDIFYNKKLNRILLNPYCIQLSFGTMLKISLYSPAGGYLCHFKFAHSSNQTKQIQSRIFTWRMLFWRYHGECENNEKWNACNKYSLYSTHFKGYSLMRSKHWPRQPCNHAWCVKP